MAKAIIEIANIKIAIVYQTLIFIFNIMTRLNGKIQAEETNMPIQ